MARRVWVIPSPGVEPSVRVAPPEATVDDHGSTGLRRLGRRWSKPRRDEGVAVPVVAPVEGGMSAAPDPPPGS